MLEENCCSEIKEEEKLTWKVEKCVITDGWTVGKRKADKMDGQCEAKWPKEGRIKKIGDDEWAKSGQVSDKQVNQSLKKSLV